MYALIGSLMLVGSLVSAPRPVTPLYATGTVVDASGGRVAGATVVVQSVGTSLQRVVQTRPDGTFSIAVPPGSYLLSVMAPGFAPIAIVISVPVETASEIVLSPAAVVEQVRVVSASRQEELREALNTRVDVVTRSRIEDSDVETVGEILREVPGVLTRRGSETSGAAGEQIQGIDSRQVLVLMDGQPLVAARGIKRGVINLDRQAVARLERVEILKGAASALYGSDAIGGVINLITREAVAPSRSTLRHPAEATAASADGHTPASGENAGRACSGSNVMSMMDST